MSNDDYKQIIFSYAFKGDGSARKLSEDETVKELKNKNPAWAHLNARDKNTSEWLSNAINYLDKTIPSALLAHETRPRMEEFDDGILLILRGVNLNPHSNPEDMISIRLWVDNSRIISLERRPLKATRDILEKIEKGTGPKNSADFIVMITDRLVERMEPVINSLDEMTDKVEEKVIDTPDREFRRKIIDIRKKAIHLRRYIAPQREVLGKLRISDQKWISADHKRYFHENYDKLTRFIEELDSVRERTQVIQDELQNLLSDRMNKNMYVLSIVAAIFLPLGFLTGLLGINVGGIPGADNTNAFMIFCAMLIFVVIAQMIIFKKMKWL